MSHKDFFKATQVHKEFMILDLIEKDSHITQREMAKALNVAVSMINIYISQFEKAKLINVKKQSIKTVEYMITKKGTERRKLLNIWYLQSSLDIYVSAKDNIVIFLNQMIDRGFQKILLYGAGEVAEIMLRVLNDDNVPLEVTAVIDDNMNRIGEKLVNVPIIGIKDIRSATHDGIMISSYTHSEKIYNHLISLNYPKNQIIQFFDF
jgi:FlaA1/EpsC-like NDP-sugar epimerase